MGVLITRGHLPVFSGLGEQPVGLGFLLQLEGRALLGEPLPSPHGPLGLPLHCKQTNTRITPIGDGGGGHRLGLELGLRSHAVWLSFLWAADVQRRRGW